jgi:competence protein ComEA
MTKRRPIMRTIFKALAALTVAVAVVSSSAALAQDKKAAPKEKATKAQKADKADKAAPAAPVDPNTADAKTLATVPGVGDALAAAIIKGRPYKTVDDLKNVKGIGDGPKFASLKKYFVVAAAPAAPAAPAPAAKSSAPSSTAAAKTAAKETKGSTAPATKLAPGQKININTASAADLDKLPDIGPVKAKAIVDYRTAHGNFATPEDIMKVSGIKEGVFAKIKDSIVVK